MEITLIGASHKFARGFATWAVGSRHALTIVGPNFAAAQALVRELGAGTPVGPDNPLGTELVVIAVPYICLHPVLTSYRRQFDGKVVVDLINPVDLETGKLIHPRAGSASEEITRAVPAARVIKAFHPRFAARDEAEQTSAEPQEVFLAGDDTNAKRLVAQLVEKGGLRAADLGPLRRAREIEVLGYQLVTNRQLPAHPSMKGS